MKLQVPVPLLTMMIMMMMHVSRGPPIERSSAIIVFDRRHKAKEMSSWKTTTGPQLFPAMR